MQFRTILPNGEIKHILARGRGSMDKYGNVSQMSGTVQDITEQKEVEFQLRTAKHAAEAASHAKAQFLANMSHEIRTPMNGVIGMTQLLLETEMTEDEPNLLSDVDYSAKSLLAIINDILDLSKIESGKLELNPISFDLPTLLDHTISIVRGKAEEKRIELLCEIAPDVPKIIFADDVRIQQI